MKKKLVISNMYRAKNKAAFFAIHQALNKLPEFDIEFHILWDDEDYRDEWSTKIDQLGAKIIDYTKQQLDQYCLDYGIEPSFLENFKKFKAIYFILQAHYFKKNNITDYYLIYDDDIILTDELFELKYCLVSQIPCLLHEPLNSGCDKSMANQLFSIYEGGWEYYQKVNPQLLGFNAGIQGIRVDMYEDFLEPDAFAFLLSLFNYKGIYDDNGKELVGPERSLIDTQQQSFFGIMNIIKSKKTPHIMTLDEYFVCPNWGHHPIFGPIDPLNEYGGWDVNLKSKIVHFIGHTVLEGVYYGKPAIFNEMVDDYLKTNKLL